LAAVALAVTAAVQWTMWRRFTWRAWLTVVACGAVAAVIVVGFVAWRRAEVAAFVSVRVLSIGAAAAMLLAPAVWTQGSVAAGFEGALPYAHPQITGVVAPTRNGIVPNGGFVFPSISVTALVAYLRANSDGERWAVAVPSAAAAEEVIITSGLSVMSIGGFLGTDPITSVAALQQRVRVGQLRYFLLSTTFAGLGFGGLETSEKTSWVAKTCLTVPAAQWQGGAPNDTAATGTNAFTGGPQAAGYNLYDCRGRV
jgi:hypothetical protein